MHTIRAIIEKTREYLQIPCVVGHEGPFARYLQADFEALGLNVEVHEGLIAVHGENRYSQIICAHIDRHGLISLGGGEYAYAAQYIKEIKYGEPNQSSRAELMDIINRFEGEEIFAYDGQTGAILNQGIIKACLPFVEDGNAVFKARGSGETRLRDIPIGTPLGYARIAEEKEGLFKGQIDNALSVATVYELFKNGYEGTALLTTEEEIGQSWRHIAEYLKLFEIETQNLFVLDTSPYKNEEPIEKGRVIFRNRDKSEIFNPRMVSAFINRCESLGMLYQIKDEYLLSVGKDVTQLGSTELGRLVQNEKRWNGATIQIPTMMYHTSYETTSPKAIENFYAFLANILIYDRLPL